MKSSHKTPLLDSVLPSFPVLSTEIVAYKKDKKLGTDAYGHVVTVKHYLGFEVAI